MMSGPEQGTMTAVALFSHTLEKTSMEGRQQVQVDLAYQ